MKVSELKSQVLVKLNSLWVLDNEYSFAMDNSFIHHGIWQVKGIKMKENCNIYSLYCVSSDSKDINIGDKRDLHEILLLIFCHEVKIIHCPKVDINQLNKTTEK
jgi:hypothetical protein